LVDGYRSEQTKDTGVKMRIILNNNILIFQSPRRLSVQQRGVVNNIIDKWMKDGIVRPSVSAYASPIVLVKKKER